MSVALGDMLREAREARGLSIDQLATITRLNPAFITALEEGRWDKLPGQVYLKPFAKTCAEALGLDLKEVYRLIDGETKEDKTDTPSPAVEDGEEPEEKKKRFDYKLPLVIIIGLVIIGLIYVVVYYEQNLKVGSGNLDIVPAGKTPAKTVVNRNRPWEKPAAWEREHPLSQRLRLEATDTVWVSVLSGPDTLYAGFISDGHGRSFISSDGFTVNLGRNDCVRGYLNGEPIPEIGTGLKGLYNFKLGGKGGD